MNKKAKLSKKKQIKTIILTVLATTFVICLIGLILSIPTITNHFRKERIETIYSSLNIPDDYYLQKQDVFGEKKVYDYDKSRTYSSSKEYLHGENVDVTAKKLKAAILNAGFKYIGEPYPGSVQLQYHFKSEKGEYIRLSVWGKPKNDAMQNKVIMKQALTDADYNVDGNAGPSKVIIKVNLDDNNE
jgi:hypothetical protein